MKDIPELIFDSKQMHVQKVPCTHLLMVGIG